MACSIGLYNKGVKKVFASVRGITFTCQAIWLSADSFVATAIAAFWDGRVLA